MRALFPIAVFVTILVCMRFCEAQPKPNANKRKAIPHVVLVPKYTPPDFTIPVDVIPKDFK